MEADYNAKIDKLTLTQCQAIEDLKQKLEQEKSALADLQTEHQS